MDRYLNYAIYVCVGILQTWTIRQQYDNVADGLFVAMISEGHVYVLNRGESVSLECNFHADQYDLFDYPVLWRKVQHDEETQVNIMGTINEPFVLSNRFEVAFASTASRYRLVLSISDVTHEDNGNYTCEVRAPEAIVLGYVTHHLFVRAPVETLTILLGDLNNNKTATQSSRLMTSHGVGVTSSLRSAHLTEDRPVTLGCVAIGGYPPPALTVRIARRDVTAECTFKNGATLSGERGLRVIQYRTERWMVAYHPRAEDDEAALKCVAQVPGLEPYIETIKLHVQYSPKVVCYTAAAFLGEKNINIQCDITSRPRVSNLYWVIDANGTALREGEVIHEYWTIVTDRHDGVVEARMYIRKTKHDSFRKYTLMAENTIDTVSKVVELAQRYKSTTERPLGDATAIHHSNNHRNSNTNLDAELDSDNALPTNERRETYISERSTSSATSRRQSDILFNNDTYRIRRTFDVIISLVVVVLSSSYV